MIRPLFCRLTCTCIVIGLISLGTTHRASADAATPQNNPALQQIIAGANSEGRLSLSWAPDVMGGAAATKLFEDGIKKEFGATIHIDFAPGADPARIAGQLWTEVQAGQSSSIDIFLGSAAQMAPLSQRDFFLPIDWHQYLPDRISPDLSEAGNKIVRIGTTLSGISYNTQLAPAKPTSLHDFLKPEWKGRIATTPYAAGFDVLLSDDMWGVNKTIDFVTALSKQISGLIRCGENERLASGEFIALVMDCSGQATSKWKAKGAPLDYALPADGTSLRYYYFALPKNVRHPDAAKLYTLFLLTPPGQALVWQTWAMDLHTYPGSHMREQIDAFEKSGGTLTEVTVGWWQKQAEIDANKDKLVKIVSQK
jgi:ABC-type Fe3+ transport system substrate-binding protein